MNPSTIITPEILQREIDYTFSAIEKVKKNESAWNYLRGVALKYFDFTEGILVRIMALIETDAYYNNYLAVGLAADIW